MDGGCPCLTPFSTPSFPDFALICPCCSFRSLPACPPTPHGVPSSPHPTIVCLPLKSQLQHLVPLNPCPFSPFLTQTKPPMSQIEARNAEELRRMSEQESGTRRRLEETHARALTRIEVSLRRAEETVADLEKVSRFYPPNAVLN